MPSAKIVFKVVPHTFTWGPAVVTSTGILIDTCPSQGSAERIAGALNAALHENPERAMPAFDRLQGHEPDRVMRALARLCQHPEILAGPPTPLPWGRGLGV